jgi:hypothetical protein
MAIPPRGLSAKDTVRVIGRLFDRYGIDRSFDRDRARDGERFQLALYCAVEEGLLRLPPKRGAPPKWAAKLGLQLLEEVESIRVKNPVIPKSRKPTLKNMRLLSVAKAIEILRAQHKKKWGRYDDRYLEKMFYDARKSWTYARRLMIFGDPVHAD